MAYIPERPTLSDDLEYLTEDIAAASAQKVAGFGSASSNVNPLYTGKAEVRTVDPKTGGEKGAKLARFSLIAAGFEWALAEHYGKGSQKYADRNWEKGYKWSLSYDALRRHLSQWLAGERYDNHKPTCAPDCTDHTGSHHLVAVGWHAAALWWFDMNQKGTNDIAPKLEHPKLA